MIRKVYSAQNKLQAGQIVNSVGRYLYKHIDTAYSIKESPNMVDVYFEIAYQLLPEYRKVKEDEEAHRMSINVNVTTYQNKIRVNVIEVSPEERTLGFDTFKPEIFENINEGMKIVLDKVRNRMKKSFKEYEFYFGWQNRYMS